MSKNLQNPGGDGMEILYHDKDLAVCIKPVGLDSELEVPAQLIQHLGGEIFPIHRLDQNVGGVMVFARTKAAAAALSKAVQEGRMVKEYVAKVRAAGFSFAVWTVDTPELARKYVDLKVDAITSNRAAWLREMFR